MQLVPQEAHHKETEQLTVRLMYGKKSAPSETTLQ